MIAVAIQHYPKRAMLKAGGDLKANSEDTNQWNQLRKPECHDNDNKQNAYPNAFQKPMMAKLEQDQTAS